MSEHTATNRDKTVPIRFAQCPACSALCDRVTCPLHAAAPKLLAALKGMLQAVEDCHVLMWSDDECILAHEAIREAKGEA